MSNSFVYQLDKIDSNLYFIGLINIESVNEIHKEINKIESDSNNTTLNFYITSDGGSAVEGLKLYDIFQSSRLDITIYVSSWVGSAATHILFTKHKVVMYKNATLIFHEIYDNISSKFSNSQSALQYSQKLMDKILSIYNNKTQEITKDWLVNDKYIDANEALEMKIIDEVR